MGANDLNSLLAVVWDSLNALNLNRETRFSDNSRVRGKLRLKLLGGFNISRTFGTIVKTSLFSALSGSKIVRGKFLFRCSAVLVFSLDALRTLW